MSRVLRRSKTKEKVSAQYGVADPDPADLDVRQTRSRQYPAAPPITGGTLRDRANIRERSESPIFISTTPDAMSTDEAIEISKKIDQEIAQEEADKGQTEEKAVLGADDSLPTCSELQTPKSAEELYEEIKLNWVLVELYLSQNTEKDAGESSKRKGELLTKALGLP